MTHEAKGSLVNGAMPPPKRPPRAPGERLVLWGRMLALFFGGFTLLNLAGEAVQRRFDASVWWIDFRPVPEAGARAALLAAGLGLVLFAARPAMAAWRRVVTRMLVLLVLAIAASNLLAYYEYLSAGVFRTSIPVPLSLGTVAAILTILFAIRRAGLMERVPPLRWGRAAAILVLLAVAFPVGQMFLFGKTDYRRPADVVVVFGAGVYADGTCTEALTDRVTTACRLHKDGLAPLVIFSGGPGFGAVHETEGMKRLALRLGLPEDVLVLDPLGVNTEATVRNTVAMLRETPDARVLAVSNFYHLPRIKMAYARHGMEVYTVPAEEPRVLRQLPWYLAREVAAEWFYYLHPLLGKQPA
jgi:vancomycin permeability regulator SanA